MVEGLPTGELDTVAIIDRDAHRRVLVADEQMAFDGDYERRLYEGDIANPEVWDRLRQEVEMTGDNTVFVLGTGREEEPAGSLVADTKAGLLVGMHRPPVWPATNPSCVNCSVQFRIKILSYL